MCVSETTSLVSFILGIVITIFMMLIIKTSISTAIGIIWIWVLGMQLAEYFIWQSISENNSKKNKIATNAALVLNLMQPIVAYICLMLYNFFCSKKNETNIFGTKIVIASIVVVIYTCVVIIGLNNTSNSTLTKPQENCHGLNLAWWNKTKTGAVYFICLILIIMLLARPFSIAILTSFFITIALLISIFFYSCNQPSMWCFLVVAYPVVLTFFLKFFKI